MVAVAIPHEQMDEIVNQHLVFEAANDVEGVLSTMTDDADHEVIPSPMGPINGQAQIREYYEMMYPCLVGGTITPVRRLYGEHFMIDESIWHGELADGRPLLLDGKTGEVDIRLLHIFNITQDGKISREQAWVDLALVHRNLGCITT